MQMAGVYSHSVTVDGDNTPKERNDIRHFTARCSPAAALCCSKYADKVGNSLTAIKGSLKKTVHKLFPPVLTFIYLIAK